MQTDIHTYTQFWGSYWLPICTVASQEHTHNFWNICCFIIYHKFLEFQWNSGLTNPEEECWMWSVQRWKVFFNWQVIIDDLQCWKESRYTQSIRDNWLHTNTHTNHKILLPKSITKSKNVQYHFESGWIDCCLSNKSCLTQPTLVSVKVIIIQTFSSLANLTQLKKAGQSFLCSGG